MKFFFPDSQDQIDPNFDFQKEKHPAFHSRQRDDRYVYEVFQSPVCDGILMSKAVIDGEHGGRYSFSQKQRLLRDGVHKFFRLDDLEKKYGQRIFTIGDCGAFSYVKEDVPPYTVDEVIQFYDQCGFDLGVSVDHVILGYDAELGSSQKEAEKKVHQANPTGCLFPELEQEAKKTKKKKHTSKERLAQLKEWENRQRITLEYAEEFMEKTQNGNHHYRPMGAAQGWSPTSYRDSVNALQEMGYSHIGLGGMVPLKTEEIKACLEEIGKIRKEETRLHLFGVTRCDHIEEFARFGVASFDSTSPFLQSFKDDRHNYYLYKEDDAIPALRVPQVSGNPALKRAILSGKIKQNDAFELEQETLRALVDFDEGKRSVASVVEVMHDYEQVFQEAQVDTKPKKDMREQNRRVLESRAWKKCPCVLCQKHGIQIIIFRGTERNKRRGFHNLFVFHERLRRNLKQP